MPPEVLRGLAATAAALALLPGVAAAGPVDPWALAEATSLQRAAASFALVVLSGGAALALFSDLVDRSTDASMARPVRSVGYGVAAHLALGFVGLYLVSQVARLVPGMGGLGVVAVGVLFLSLAGLGFAVVGSAATALVDGGGPWHGLVAVAATVAVAWFLLPVEAGLVAWVALASAGVGGPTRAWLRASQPSVAGGEPDG